MLKKGTVTQGAKTQKMATELARSKKKTREHLALLVLWFKSFNAKNTHYQSKSSVFRYTFFARLLLMTN